MFSRADLRPGETVLVLGAGSGTKRWAASSRGAESLYSVSSAGRTATIEVPALLRAGATLGSPRDFARMLAFVAGSTGYT